VKSKETDGLDTWMGLNRTLDTFGVGKPFLEIDGERKTNC
jgi:hypothetical protein